MLSTGFKNALTLADEPSLRMAVYEEYKRYIDRSYKNDYKKCPMYLYIFKDESVGVIIENEQKEFIILAEDTLEELVANVKERIND